MSDRAQRCRQEGRSLMGEVAGEAVEALDAALPDQFLAIAGQDDRASSLIVSKIAARAIEGLDDEDVVLGLWQNRDRLLDRAPARAGCKIGDAIRSVIEDVLRHHLHAHLERRAQRFTAAHEDGIAA